MFLMCWVTCFLCTTFLYTSVQYQGADGKKAISRSSMLKASYCACYDQEGRIYNLAPLQRDDGLPRFTTKGSDNYNISYNPCRSFSLGSRQKSNCFGDVAICWWSNTNSSYKNIGKQSTASCRYNQETLIPQLVYTNEGTFPKLKAIVNFGCDPRKKEIEDAEFKIIDDSSESVKKFLLIHNCACPNGCPKNPSTTSSTTKFSDKIELEIFVSFGALAVLAIAGPLIIYLCHVRYDNNGNQRQPLICEGNDNNYDNQFDADPNEETRPANLQNVPQPSPRSPSSSSSNIPRAYKEDFNIKSNRHQIKGILA